MCHLYKANSLLESLCGPRNLQRKMDDWDPGLESRFMFCASTSQLFSLSGSQRLFGRVSLEGQKQEINRQAHGDASSLQQQRYQPQTLGFSLVNGRTLCLEASSIQFRVALPLHPSIPSVAMPSQFPVLRPMTAECLAVLKETLGMQAFSLLPP